MEVLITGGAGFIGSHLTELFLDRGSEVTVLDDLSTGAMENVEHLREHPGFRLRVGNCQEEALVMELVGSVDLTVHLAAAVGVRLIVDRPVHTIETNVRATEVVLNAAARTGAKVILASTSEVYGKSTRVPFNETDDITLGPTTRSRWSYACSKALDEWLAFAYHAERDVPIVVARLFNTVGPRQTGRYGMVLPTFVGQALSGEAITVFGDGSQRRCFAHVRDVVTSLFDLSMTPEAVGEVVNVGATREISILELAALVKELSGTTSPIEMIPYEVAYARGFEDMPRRIPDVSKLVKLTGRAPSTPLERIVEDVLADQRRALGT